MSLFMLRSDAARVILVTAPELQEDWLGTKDISQLLFIRFTYEFLSLRL